MAKYNSIRVNDSAKTTIKMLSKRIGKSEFDYANRMVKFINETGIDVFTDTLPSIPDLISNLDKRMVSFLKKREQDFFVPMDKAFKKMIELHTRTFESLETLDVLNFSNEQRNLIVPSDEKKPLLSTENNNEKNDFDSERKETIKQPNSQTLSQEEKEDFLIQIERAKKEKETYENELKFLLENITPSKSISGPKFVCNLSTRDLERIKLFVSGN